MWILSHRGYWKDPAEKNGIAAFERSFALGFGTETDVRDCSGELVISHDMPTGGELTLDGLLDIAGARDLPLALNVKADGLAAPLRAKLQTRPLTRWFTFDMSVPDLVVQLRLGMPAFTRASEHERTPPCYDQAIGVWLDAFESQWYSVDTINSYLADGKQVCVVSPELHGRDPAPLWQSLRGSLQTHPALMLCTDRPEDARAFFGEAR
ncbi:MAG: phosphodiesterase [Reyranellaceae bacterium]